MIEILDKKDCSGCSACAMACPKKCISMVPDDEHFLYPSVDTSQCINCGACDRVCPIKNTSFVEKDGMPDGYLVYENDNSIRLNSAAGGGFSALAVYVMNELNGVVFGAAYDDEYSVYHTYIEKIEDLQILQKSKYVQSSMKDNFCKVKEFLKADRYVLFSGTACQVYGLKSYLGKLADSEKLYCIDLSCHGVPSQKLLKKYLKFWEEKENSKIEKFTMRAKRVTEYGYEGGVSFKFANGNERFFLNGEDLYGRCFWGEISSRPSCYDCHYRTVWRTADITLGDCWFLDCFVPGEKDRTGVTMALVHSEKGKQLLGNCKTLKKYKADTEKLIKSNGGMIYSNPVKNPNRAEFFARLDDEPLDKIVADLLPKKEVKEKNPIKKSLEKIKPLVSLKRKVYRKKRFDQRMTRVIPKNALGEMK